MEEIRMLKDLILKNRSVRRFHEETVVEMDTLKELVELARLSASGSNLQPLKFVLSCDPRKNAQVFPNLAWAAYLNDWSGPSTGERPSAYIIILGDTRISKNFGCDHGIAAQSILLGAVEKGLCGCMIGSVQRDNLRKELAIPSQYEVLLVLALGKPNEKVVIDPVDPTHDIEYWRDKDGVHHVPKRSLEDLILDLQ
jgi:nitroreductase